MNDIYETTNQAASAKFCGHCGAPLEEGATFCAQCGAEQSPDDYVPAVEEPVVETPAVDTPVKVNPALNEKAKKSDIIIPIILGVSAMFFTFVSGILTFIFDELQYFKSFSASFLHYLLNCSLGAVMVYIAIIFVILYVLIQLRKKSPKSTFLGIAYFSMAVSALIGSLYIPIYYIISLFEKTNVSFSFDGYANMLMRFVMFIMFVLAGVFALRRKSNAVFAVVSLAILGVVTATTSTQFYTYYIDMMGKEPEVWLTMVRSISALFSDIANALVIATFAFIAYKNSKVIKEQA